MQLGRGEHFSQDKCHHQLAKRAVQRSALANYENDLTDSFHHSQVVVTVGPLVSCIHTHDSTNKRRFFSRCNLVCNHEESDTAPQQGRWRKLDHRSTVECLSDVTRQLPSFHLLCTQAAMTNIAPVSSWVNLSYLVPLLKGQLHDLFIQS